MILESEVGFVAIGRNEGERLRRCLDAILDLHPGHPIVYVDSGSTDDSVQYAQSRKVDVVQLDMSVPFTAARARNTGYRKLLSECPEVRYIQFLDGDCEISVGWLEMAISFLKENLNAGICSGRRRERYPENSIYNALIDIEWNTPVGQTIAVLGDMLVRVSTLEAIDGFDDTIIAAEDDDLCLRARKAGYQVFRLDKDMSTHDADITMLSQWFKRSMRGGHGYANIYHLHGRGKEQYFRRNLLSALLWGGIVPLTILAFLFLLPWVGAVLAILYFMMWLRLGLKMMQAGYEQKIAFPYAALIYSGKVFECLGALRYVKNKILARKHQLIEYK